MSLHGSQPGEKAPAFARGLLAMAHEARQAAIARSLNTRIRLLPGTADSYAQSEATNTDPNTSATQPWVPLGGRIGADLNICSPTAGVTLATSTPASCSSVTPVNICFQPNGNITVSTTNTCPAAGGPTGATLYVRTIDDKKHFKLYIFGLTGLPRLVDSW
jgi:hypothetical protein